MKIACIQCTSSDNVEDNITRISAMVARAAKQGARFVTLPENVALMPKHKTQAREEAVLMEKHPAYIAFRALAKKHNIYLLIGSLAVKPTPHARKRVNRSILISPAGKPTALYDKIHLYDVQLANGERYFESEQIQPGSKAVVAKLDKAKLGMTICYDVRFPHLFRALAHKGADIITVPAAFTAFTGAAHWHTLLRARAIENGCYIIAPAQTGTHANNRKTYGHSLIINPWGDILADGGEGENIVMADIDLSEVKRVRASIPSLTHDRKFS